MTPTAEQTRRIEEAILDCERYISREEGRCADLRPVEVQERLDWMRAHRATLQARLAAV